MRCTHVHVTLHVTLCLRRVRVEIFEPPVLRRFADSPAPHQNLVRAETAAELADYEAVHVYGIAL
jgi:hypothetical protein